MSVTVVAVEYKERDEETRIKDYLRLYQHRRNRRLSQILNDTR